MVLFEKFHKVLLILSTYLVCIRSANYQDVMRLSNLLLQNYSKHIRPVVDQSFPVDIKAKIALKAISSYDEMAGTLKVVGGLNLLWTDEIIRWDPLEHGNTSSVSLPEISVWHPVFYLINSAKNMDISSDLESCNYLYNGNAAARHGFIVSSLCSPNTRYYPNDAQECSLTFSTFRRKSRINLIYGRINLGEFEENSKWEIQNPRVEIGQIGFYPTIDLRMTIKRRPTFLMLTLVLPILLLGFMNLFVFKLSHNSGERVSFSVTVLLSFAVFTTLISDKMPHTSNNLSILCIYLLTTLIYSSTIVVATVISINIYNIHDFEQLPRVIRAITIHRLKCFKKIRENHEEETYVNTKRFNGETGKENNIQFNSDLSDHLKIKMAGQLVDMFFFTVFGIIYVLGSIIFLAIIW